MLEEEARRGRRRVAARISLQQNEKAGEGVKQKSKSLIDHGWHFAFAPPCLDWELSSSWRRIILPSCFMLSGGGGDDASGCSVCVSVCVFVLFKAEGGRVRRLLCRSCSVILLQQLHQLCACMSVSSGRPGMGQRGGKK